MKPKVSIIMPVLNGHRYIALSVQSIAAQSYKNFELVVVDDGSTDETKSIVDGFRDRIRVQYIRHERSLGIPVSMNDGVRHAEGDLIAFLDHDDMWCPEMLEVQVGYLDENQDVAMVHSDFATIDPDGNVLEASMAQMRGRGRPSGIVFKELFMDSFIVGIGVLVRRECFDKYGYFDESMRFGDYHMWLRIAKNCRVDYIPRVLSKYRQHFKQSTRRAAAAHIEEPVACVALKKILDSYPECQKEIGARKIRERLASIYFDQGYYAYKNAEFTPGRKAIARAIKQWPFCLKYYLLYGATLFHISKN